MDAPWVPVAGARHLLAARLLHCTVSSVAVCRGAPRLLSGMGPRVRLRSPDTNGFPGGLSTCSEAAPLESSCGATVANNTRASSPSFVIVHDSGWRSLPPPQFLSAATLRTQPPQTRPKPSLLPASTSAPLLPKPHPGKPSQPQVSRLGDPCQQQPWLPQVARMFAAAAAAPTVHGAPVSSPASITPATPPALMLVHPRYRGVEDREEALRLAESLIGGPCAFLEVGGSKLQPRRQSSSSSSSSSSSRGAVVSGLRSTYFGSGTMVELARRLDALEAMESGSESGSGSGMGSGSGSSGVPKQHRRETWDAAAAGGATVEAAAGDHAAGSRGLVPETDDTPAREGIVGGGSSTSRGDRGGRGGGGSGGGGSEGGATLQGASGSGGGGGGPRAPAFINEVLTPLQERNIEQGLGRPVVDRVGLILRLFAQRAHTREARLQVELASLSYMLPRLVRMRGADGRRGAFGVGLGWGGISSELGPAPQVVSARQRGSTGAGGLGGGGGSGDPELRQQRFRIKQRLATLRAELRAVAASRGVQRQGRRAAGLPTVAIVGYTNVGKTSLAGAMCSRGAGLPPPSDMLFATLDPAVRRMWLPTRGSHVAVSDTVGFIRDLPVGLVAAFRATLEEVVAADMLLHVLDASSPNVVQQRNAVLAVLRQLGVSEHVLTRRTVEVWNKVDLLGHSAHTVHGVGARQPYDGATAAEGRGAFGHGGGGAATEAAHPTPVGLWSQDEAEAEEEHEDEDEEEEEVTEEDAQNADGGEEDVWRDDGDDDDVSCDRALHRSGPVLRPPAASHSNEVSWQEQDGGPRKGTRPGRGPGCANGSGSGDAADDRDGPPPAAPPPRPLRRPARRLFPDIETLRDTHGGSESPQPQPEPQPEPQSHSQAQSQPHRSHPADRHELHVGPLPPPPQPQPSPLQSGLPSEGRRGLHSAADAGPGAGCSHGPAAGPESGAWFAEAAGDSCVEGEGGEGGGDGDGGQEEGGSWAADAGCLAAAADLVRRVHGVGGAPPAAVVLAAVAQGGFGVAEVKAAVDAVLRAAPEEAAAAPARRATDEAALRSGSTATPAVGSLAAAGAAAAGSAEAAEAALAGRWVSEQLWLAECVPWPLPPPQQQQQQQQPEARFAWRHWREAAGADGSNVGSDGGGAVGNFGQGQDDHGGGGAGAGESGEAVPSPSPSALPVSVSTWHERAETGSATGRKSVAREPYVSWDAGQRTPPAGSKATAGAAGVPDGEELEELIRFLRRRRPRGKSDE